MPSTLELRWKCLRRLKFCKFELYPKEFKDVVKAVVHHQFQNYVKNVWGDSNFANLKGLSDICAKFGKTNKFTTFDVVYKLMKCFDSSITVTKVTKLKWLKYYASKSGMLIPKSLLIEVVMSWSWYFNLNGTNTTIKWKNKNQTAPHQERKIKLRCTQMMKP